MHVGADSFCFAQREGKSLRAIG